VPPLWDGHVRGTDRRHFGRAALAIAPVHFSRSGRRFSLPRLPPRFLTKIDGAVSREWPAGRVWCSVKLLSDAGEVGDGPDQGHSGGADSVPPAPKTSNLCCLTVGIRLDEGRGSSNQSTNCRRNPRRAKTRVPCGRLHTRKARSFLGRLKLGLRGSRQPGPEEHGSETGKPGPENVDRSRATLWHLLLLLRRRRALPPPTAPSAPLLAMLTVLSKCRGI